MEFLSDLLQATGDNSILKKAIGEDVVSSLQPYSFDVFTAQLQTSIQQVVVANQQIPASETLSSGHLLHLPSAQLITTSCRKLKLFEIATNLRNSHTTAQTCEKAADIVANITFDALIDQCVFTKDLFTKCKAWYMRLQTVQWRQQNAERSRLAQPPVPEPDGRNVKGVGSRFALSVVSSQVRQMSMNVYRKLAKIAKYSAALKYLWTAKQNVDNITVEPSSSTEQGFIIEVLFERKKVTETYLSDISRWVAICLASLEFQSGGDSLSKVKALWSSPSLLWDALQLPQVLLFLPFYTITNSGKIQHILRERALAANATQVSTYNHQAEQQSQQQVDRIDEMKQLKAELLMAKHELTLKDDKIAELELQLAHTTAQWRADVHDLHRQLDDALSDHKCDDDGKGQDDDAHDDDDRSDQDGDDDDDDAQGGLDQCAQQREQDGYDIVVVPGRTSPVQRFIASTRDLSFNGDVSEDGDDGHDSWHQNARRVGVVSRHVTPLHRIVATPLSHTPLTPMMYMTPTPLQHPRRRRRKSIVSSLERSQSRVFLPVPETPSP